MRVPDVDPREPWSLYKRTVTPAFLAPAGQWYLKEVSRRLDPPLARISGGRLSTVPGVPLVMLETVGAKSGLPRVSALVYFSDGGRAIVMASNYGSGKHPGWYHNIKANPEVTLSSRGRSGRYLGEITSGEERERLWELAKTFVGAYGRYEGMTEGAREIPVVAFSPLD